MPDEDIPSDMDRLISELSDVVTHLARIADTLDMLADRFDEITPETVHGRRFLRIIQSQSG